MQRALAATDVMVSEVLPACDIFVGLSGMGVKSAKVARQKHNSKVIIDRGAQHVLEQMRLNSGKPSGFLNDWYVQRELSSYEQADVISVPTQVVKRSFSKNGFHQKKVFVNPYGVDTNLFYPDVPGKKVFNRVLFVGSWSYQKGCDYLPDIIESNPKTEFVHCGVVKDLELPKGKNFRSMGKTSRSDLAALMRSSDLLILPSRQDGFGLVLLEALSSGLLVVASDQTGAPEIKSYLPDKSSIQVFRSEDPEDLRNAFEQARDIRSNINRSDIHQITKANFSWAAYAKRFQERFYNA
ncbi:MAG: glycosyltransferase family 4 protein [Henriciella sp.]